jgi:CDP-ribitol ribitolphosphotransferase
MKIIYAPLKLLPQQNKVVLITRNHSHTSIDFEYFAWRLQERFPNCEVVILNHKMITSFGHVRDILIELYHLATARAAVVDTYIIPVSCLKHRPGLVVVQIWHALGAVKAFGHLAIGMAEGSSRTMAETMHMHSGYTYVTCGGRATIDLWSKSFNVNPDIIRPIGMPRVDYLLNDLIASRNKHRMEKLYPIIAQRKVILYVPTFRKHRRIDPSELIAAIDPTEYVLLIKQHPLDPTHLPDNLDHVIVFRDEIDVLELLSSANYVVTDYSAICFEAALIGKPLFFWAYDIDTYASRRGFVMEYPSELPGFASRSAEAIVSAIESDNWDPRALRAFASKYVNLQDGHCTDRIIDLLALDRGRRCLDDWAEDEPAIQAVPRRASRSPMPIAARAYPA